MRKAASAKALVQSKAQGAQSPPNSYGEQMQKHRPALEFILQAICSPNMRKRSSPSPPSTPAATGMERPGT